WSTVWPLGAHARASTQGMDSSSSATRMVPDRLGSGVDMILTDGKGDDEASAAAGPGLVGDDPAVLGDDAVADRQPEPGAAGLGGEERREEMALGGLGDARGGALDRDGQELAAVRATADVVARLDPGGDGERAVSPERLDGVADQIEEHLRQLRPVAQHLGEAGIELGAERDGAPVRRLALKCE